MKDLITKIKDLEMTIWHLTEAIDGLEAKIAERQFQLKRTHTHHDPLLFVD